ncbi:MAG: patatin-like phospholipase family protein [Planctomycetaceae bacterium]|nr:patatin-like phospholipase family protein [Planctomycetaceae bacterium]
MWQSLSKVHRLWLGALERRFVLLGFVSLTIWLPLLSWLPFQEVFANGLLLESAWQIAALSTVNMLAIIFCVSILRMYNGRNQNTLEVWRWFVGHEDKAWSWRAYLLATTTAIVSPLTLVLWHDSEFSKDHNSFLQFNLAITGGLCLGWLLMAFAGQVKAFLIGNVEGKNYFPFEFRRRIGVIRSSELRRQLHFDLQMLAYLVIIWCSHYLVMRLFSTQLTWVVSAPLVLIQLIWICCAVLSGCSFWFDKIRVPTTIVVLLLLMMMRSIPYLGREYTFPVVSRASTNENPTDFAQQVAAQRVADRDALENEQDRQKAVSRAASEFEAKIWQAIERRLEGKETLVVVTCPGGGIHAAAWSAKVLESLSQVHPEFTDSVVVISAVSGGSVGALHFASQAYRPASKNSTSEVEQRRTSTFDSATMSSLEAISYSMLTDDFYGLFLPRLSIQDRGRSLEASMARHLPPPIAGETLGTWGDAALNGRMPFIVFNATDAVTGRRVLFDTVPTPIRASNISLTSRPYNFRELLDENNASVLDVKAVTAARVSATFPYVSPFVSAENGSALGQAVALGDGGYADNEGIVSAIDWIEFILRNWNNQTGFKRILVVRVMPSGMADSLQTPQTSWLVRGVRWLTGPLETIANVRSTSQAERGNLESDLAARSLKTVQSEETAVDPGPMNPLGQIELPPALCINTNFEVRQEAQIGFDPSQAGMRRWDDVENPTRWQSKARDAFAKREFEQSRPDAQQPSVRPDQPPITNSSPTFTFPVELNSEEEVQLENLLRSKVIIVDVPFLFPYNNTDPARDASAAPTIPLNWKLSREQKEWYQPAWERVYQADLKPLFDRLFPNGDSESVAP